MESLWGSEFDIKEDDLAGILKKVRSKKDIEVSTEKKLKSKTV